MVRESREDSRKTLISYAGDCARKRGGLIGSSGYEAPTATRSATTSTTGAAGGRTPRPWPS